MLHFWILMTPRDGKEKSYMKSICKFIIKCVWILLAAAGTVFGVVQAVYWLNIDNKIMFLLHRLLNKRTDRVSRDRRF